MKCFTPQSDGAISIPCTPDRVHVSICEQLPDLPFTPDLPTIASLIAAAGMPLPGEMAFGSC